MKECRSSIYGVKGDDMELSDVELNDVELNDVVNDGMVQQMGSGG